MCGICIEEENSTQVGIFHVNIRLSTMSLVYKLESRRKTPVNACCDRIFTRGVPHVQFFFYITPALWSVGWLYKIVSPTLSLTWLNVWFREFPSTFFSLLSGVKDYMVQHRWQDGPHLTPHIIDLVADEMIFTTATVHCFFFFTKYFIERNSQKEKPMALYSHVQRYEIQPWWALEYIKMNLYPPMGICFL